MHYIVTGLAFGDEGKGTTVDYLARNVPNPLVVRHNGGSQAAHNVVTPEGQHHTFAQFGSGTLAGAPTFLSQFTILNPANMISEADHLVHLGVKNPFAGVRIAESALVVTPYHIAANRMREDARGEGRHGSCGQGIGETVESAMRFGDMAIRVKDLRVWPGLHDKMKFWREVKRIEMEDIGVNTAGTVFDDDDLMMRCLNVLHNVARMKMGIVSDDWLERKFDSHTVIFEGAQGVLLDERLGFHPHTTWSNTTSHNARLLLGGREAYHLGVTRAYTTRHGSGPFVTDLGGLGQTMFPEEHNGAGEYQGAFRVGAFDFLSLTYSVRSLTALGQGVDGLAVTHLDRLPEDILNCWCWETSGSDEHVALPIYSDLSFPSPNIEHQRQITEIANTARPRIASTGKRMFLEMIDTELETPIVLESYGPTHADKKAHLLQGAA